MKRLLLVFLIVLVAVVGGGFFAVQYLTQPYKGYPGEEVFVEVPPGSGVSAIGRRLVEAGVVRNATAFRLAMRLHGAAAR